MCVLQKAGGSAFLAGGCMVYSIIIPLVKVWEKSAKARTWAPCSKKLRLACVPPANKAAQARLGKIWRKFDSFKWQLFSCWLLYYAWLTRITTIIII